MKHHFMKKDVYAVRVRHEVYATRVRGTRSKSETSDVDRRLGSSPPAPWNSALQGAGFQATGTLNFSHSL